MIKPMLHGSKSMIQSCQEHIWDKYEFLLKSHNGATTARYHQWTLFSVFQPIFSPSHGRVVGYEGLLRGRDRERNIVFPEELFGFAEKQGEIIELDRLSRLLHVSNFVDRESGEGWLFINLSSDVINTKEKQQFASFTQHIVSRYQLAPERVVIEVLEKAISDEVALIETIQHYRDFGFRIAIDDFGAGESNIDRIWKLAPDIVKLDRTLISNVEKNLKARRLLPALVSLMHQIGGLVLLEGIETQEEAVIAIDADVDLVQGFAFAKPEENFCEAHVEEELFSALFSHWQYKEKIDSSRHLEWLTLRAGLFWDEVRLVEEGQPPTSRQEESQVLRWYTLDDRGRQLGENFAWDQKENNHNTSCNPLRHGKGADWSRRPYYRRAMRYPGEVQVTGPYFSIPDSSFCVTFSIARHRRKDVGIRIYCCDFAWSEEEEGHAFLISGSIRPHGSEIERL